MDLSQTCLTLISQIVFLLTVPPYYHLFHSQDGNHCVERPALPKHHVVECFRTIFNSSANLHCSFTP